MTMRAAIGVSGQDNPQTDPQFSFKMAAISFYVKMGEQRRVF